MLVVRITSGLGNQMFQYCFYLLLKRLYPEATVKADLTWFYAHNDHHGYELQRIFGHNPGFSIEEAGYAELFRATGLIPNLLMPGSMTSFKNGREYKGRFSEKGAVRFEDLRRYPNRVIREFTMKKRLPFLIDENGADALGTGMSLPVAYDAYQLVHSLDLNRDYYFTGFWTEERFFCKVLSEAVAAFVFPDFSEGFFGETEEERGKNKELSEEIKEDREHSVSIHLRRGDYLKEYKDMFRVLSRDYYESAVRLLCDRAGLDTERLKLYIFSDDPERAESELGFIKNRRVISHNRGEASFRDMQLMSLCGHNIIANSTFSQWAALLNRGKGHLTVYPRAYLKERDNEVKSLPGWMML